MISREGSSRFHGFREGADGAISWHASSVKDDSEQFTVTPRQWQGFWDLLEACRAFELWHGREFGPINQTYWSLRALNNGRLLVCRAEWIIPGWEQFRRYLDTWEPGLIEQARCPDCWDLALHSPLPLRPLLCELNSQPPPALNLERLDQGRLARALRMGLKIPPQLDLARAQPALQFAVVSQLVAAHDTMAVWEIFLQSRHSRLLCQLVRPWPEFRQRLCDWMVRSEIQTLAQKECVVHWLETDPELVGMLVGQELPADLAALCLRPGLTSGRPREMVELLCGLLCEDQIPEAGRSLREWYRLPEHRSTILDAARRALSSGSLEGVAALLFQLGPIILPEVSAALYAPDADLAGCCALVRALGPEGQPLLQELSLSPRPEIRICACAALYPDQRREPLRELASQIEKLPGEQRSRHIWEFARFDAPTRLAALEYLDELASISGRGSDYAEIADCKRAILRRWGPIPEPDPEPWCPPARSPESVEAELGMDESKLKRVLARVYEMQRDPKRMDQGLVEELAQLQGSQSAALADSVRRACAAVEANHPDQARQHLRDQLADFHDILAWVRADFPQTLL